MLPAQRLLSQIRELGCEWEGARSKLICINVPPSSVLERVAKTLTEAGATWEYADPKYEDLFPSS